MLRSINEIWLQNYIWLDLYSNHFIFRLGIFLFNPCEPINNRWQWLNKKITTPKIEVEGVYAPKAFVEGVNQVLQKQVITKLQEFYL